MTLKDLEELALRLDEEKFRLRYRWPTAGDTGGPVQYVERVDPLLDVAEETGVLFVSQEGRVVKVLLEEAIEAIPDGQEK